MNNAVAKPECVLEPQWQCTVETVHDVRVLSSLTYGQHTPPSLLESIY